MKKVIFAGLCLLAAGAFTSCKGRTMKNMEPTGDTVEVQIATQDVETDSAATNIVDSSADADVPSSEAAL